jgi:hypothetical protein
MSSKKNPYPPCIELLGVSATCLQIYSAHIRGHKSYWLAYDISSMGTIHASLKKDMIALTWKIDVLYYYSIELMSCVYFYFLQQRV